MFSYKGVALPISVSKASVKVPPKTYWFIDSKSRLDLGGIVDKLKKDFNPTEIYLKFLDINQRVKLNLPVKRRMVCSVTLPKENIWSNLSKKTRNQVKKSQSYDLTVKTEVSPKAILNLYEKTMTRLKSPIKENFPKDFSSYFTLGVYKNHRLAGVNIGFIAKNYLNLMYNFSDEKYWSYCVNDFLYFETLKLAISRGVDSLDWGPSLISDESHRHFKEGFGAVEYPLFEYYWSSNIIKKLLWKINIR